MRFKYVMLRLLSLYVNMKNIPNSVNFPRHDACPREFVAVHEYEPVSDRFALAMVKTYHPSFSSFNEYLNENFVNQKKKV